MNISQVFIVSTIPVGRKMNAVTRVLQVFFFKGFTEEDGLSNHAYVLLSFMEDLLRFTASVKGNIAMYMQTNVDIQTLHLDIML